MKLIWLHILLVIVATSCQIVFSLPPPLSSLSPLSPRFPQPPSFPLPLSSPSIPSIPSIPSTPSTPLSPAKVNNSDRLVKRDTCNGATVTIGTSTIPCTKCYSSVADWSTLNTILTTDAATGDVICFNLATPVTKQSADNFIVITKSITIAHLAVQGNNVSSTKRPFIINTNINVNFVNTTFKTFVTSFDVGAVVYISGGGTTTFTNCQFLNNQNTYEQSNGIVFVSDWNTKVIFNGCIFDGNISIDSSYAGGAVSGLSSTVFFADCVFSNNRASYGAAIAIYDGKGLIDNCTFTTNYCTAGSGCGSAIVISVPFASNLNLGIIRSTFLGNYCETPTTTTFGVIYIFALVSNPGYVGISSTTFGGVSLPILVNGQQGVFDISVYNTCSYQLFYVWGTANIVQAGTNALSGSNSFCSTCANVYPDNKYCDLMSSTIDCTNLIASEPIGTPCICSDSLFSDVLKMDCVAPESCSASVPFGDSVNHVCTNAAGCSNTAYPYGDPINHVCTTSAGCAATTNSFADSSTHLCTALVICSEDTTPFRDPLSNTCTDAPGCSSTANPYGDMSSHTCVSICPPGTIGDSSTHLCCRSCPSGFYLLPGSCTTSSLGQCTSKPQACNVGGGNGICTCSSTTVDCTDLLLDEMLSFSNALPSVTQVKLGGNLFTSVPSYAFSGLTSVTTVSFLDSMVNKVNYGAFLGAHSLTSIDFSNNQLSDTSFGPGSFYGTPENVVVNFSGNIDLASASPSTYEDSGSGSILPCHPTCKTCFGAGSGSCCPENCLTCSDSTTCDTCYDGFTMNDDGVCVSDHKSKTCSGTNKPLTNGIAVLDKFPINSIKYGRGCFIDSPYSPLFSGFSVSNTDTDTDTRYCCKRGSEGVITKINGTKFCQFGCSGFEKTYVNYAWVNGVGPNDEDELGSRCYADCFVVY